MHHPLSLLSRAARAFSGSKGARNVLFGGGSLGFRDKQAERGEVVIKNVTKRFRKRTVLKKGYSTIKSDLLSAIGGRRSSDFDGMLVALDAVDLSIRPGQSFGVIGRNGSGKSTLLKLIAGIYRPDEGVVATGGRISALIELGAGFHPDFTGRENVYLGGIMYGLSRREIDARFDDIVAYAELEGFIDDPVRTYSSGMYMRLGFSLAIHTDPDILLVDEVLAVGDAAFTHRCQDTISEFKRLGKTIIFVTHDLTSVVRWCDEAVWLDRGVLRERGEPRRVVDRYLEHIETAEEQALDAKNLQMQTDTSADEDSGTDDPDAERRWGSREVEIVSVRMLDNAGAATWLFRTEESALIEVEYRINEPIDDLVLGIGILRSDGLEVHGSNTDIERIDVPLPAEGTPLPCSGTYRYRIDRLGLLESSYYLDVAVHRSDGYPFDYHHRRHTFSVRSATPQAGVYEPEHSWEIDARYPAKETVQTGETGAFGKSAAGTR